MLNPQIVSLKISYLSKKRRVEGYKERGELERRNAFRILSLNPLQVNDWVYFLEEFVGIVST